MQSMKPHWLPTGKGKLTDKSFSARQKKRNGSEPCKKHGIGTLASAAVSRWQGCCYDLCISCCDGSIDLSVGCQDMLLVSAAGHVPVADKEVAAAHCHLPA